MTTPYRNDHLSASRGRVGNRYYLMTPDTMVENTLPGLPEYSAVVLAAPQGSPARFGQYLLTLTAGAASALPQGAGFENFLIVLGGEVVVASPEEGEEWALGDGGYLFLPEGRSFSLAARTAARLLWVKKRYVAVDGVEAPPVVTGRLSDIAGADDDSIDGSWGRLLPGDQRFDLAMNIMRFQGGARFRMVEIHHQEHGLYLLEGGGVYHLDGDHLDVQQDDFIYMAPYCTQAFTATGTSPSAYLLYKDVNRDGF